MMFGIKRKQKSAGRPKSSFSFLIHGIACFCFIISGINSNAQGNFIADHYKSRAAFAEKQFEEYISIAQPLLDRSSSPDLMFKLSIANYAIGNSEKALSLLQNLNDFGLCYQADTVQEFSTWADDDQFKEVTTNLAKNCDPILNSTKAFVLDDPTLIPEGIAAHPQNEAFYVGSLTQNKVIRFGTEDEQVDATSPGRDDSMPILGMKVDPATNELWFCSASEYGPTRGQAGIFSLNLNNGQIDHKIILNEEQDHLFNDLAFVDDRIYITDSWGSSVYQFDRTSKDLNRLELTAELIYPNGIASASSYLFVAHGLGIERIDLNDNSAIKIDADNKTHLNRIDGLYFYKNSLIAIQGAGPRGDRVVRFYLDDELKKVERVEVLERFNPIFDIPTTGSILNDAFYFIANSQIFKRDSEGNIPEGADLQNTVILKLDLKD